MGLKKYLLSDGTASRKISINRTLADLLGWDESTELDLSTDGSCLIIRPTGVARDGGKIGRRSKETIRRKTQEMQLIGG